MLTKEKILLNIQAYKAAIDEVNTEFLQHCNGWHLGRLPKHGKLGLIEYQFHGIGCRAEKLSQVIDYNYNIAEHIERVTTDNIHLLVRYFDIYRFFNFVKSGPDHLELTGLEADSLKPFFDDLVAEGKLEKPDPWQFKFPSFTLI